MQILVTVRTMQTAIHSMERANVQLDSAVKSVRMFVPKELTVKTVRFVAIARMMQLVRPRLVSVSVNQDGVDSCVIVLVSRTVMVKDVQKLATVQIWENVITSLANVTANQASGENFNRRILSSVHTNMQC